MVLISREMLLLNVSMGYEHGAATASGSGSSHFAFFKIIEQLVGCLEKSTGSTEIWGNTKIL